MLQEIEEISPTTKRLKIQIPPDVINEEINRAYDKLRTTVKMPGFRAGKVPQAILEKKFARDVEAQVIERIVPEFYLKAIKEAQMIPVNYPTIEEKIELVRNQPLSFTVTLEVKPEIKNLAYEGIELKEKTFSVGDAEVDAAIKMLQESRALYKVSEDAVKEDDMAIIDYDAFIDGSMVNELSVKDYPFIAHRPLSAEEDKQSKVAMEISNVLIGKKRGDVVEVKIHFDDTHPNKTIAGKEVLLKISITEAKRKFVPAVDEEFLKELGCKDLDELKKKTYDNLYKKKKEQITMEYKKELLNTLISSHNFEVPSSMIESELEVLIINAKRNIPPKGDEQTIDNELRQKFAPIARDNVKGVLILEAIGRKENVGVGDGDVNKFINELAEQYKITPEEVKKLFIAKEGSLDGVKSRMFGEKVLDFVLRVSNFRILKTVEDSDG